MASNSIEAKNKNNTNNKSTDSLPADNKEWLSRLTNNSSEEKDDYNRSSSSTSSQWLSSIDYQQLYHNYNNRVKELNYIYYEDMVPLGLKLFQLSADSISNRQIINNSNNDKSNPVLQAVQSHYNYFFCDEFQDTNE